MIRILTLVLALSFISGCESLQTKLAYKRGTLVSPTDIQTLMAKKPTKQDVINQFGEPQRSGQGAIEYHYQQINHLYGGVDQTVKIIFGEDGRVKDIKTIQGSGMGNPLTS